MPDDPIKMPPSKDRAVAGGGTATTLPKSLLSRVGLGLRIIAGDADWFGPAKPITPTAPPSVEGRQFDYPVGYNLVNSQPRSDEVVGFDKMRALADNCDVLRIVIETRKDQMARLKWTIKPKDEKKKNDARCQQLMDFFAYPDQVHSWDDWMRMLLEEVFVTDAPCLYPRKTLGGGMYSLEPMDGTTIKLLIDSSGRRPLPPGPAYQQILKGMPAVNYTADELIYKPRNPRVWKVYGYSHVEQIITTVHTLIRRALSQLDYFEAGTIPDAIAGVPDTWTMGQIEEFQGWFNDKMAADKSLKHTIRFMSKESASTYKEAKLPPLKDMYDEWLARIICYTFSVAVTPFISQTNRAVAESSADLAQQEGLVPLQRWMKNLMDFLIAKYFGISDLEFSWSEEEDIAPKVQADIDQVYLNAGVIDTDEVRGRLGLEARATAGNPTAPGQGTPMLDPFGKPMMDENGEPMLMLTDNESVIGAAGAVGSGDVQATALNGAQVASLQAMIVACAEKQLPPESVKAMVAAAFPKLNPEQIDAMVNPLANFEPVQPDPPPGLNGDDPPVDDGASSVVPVVKKSMGAGRGDLHIHIGQPEVVVDVGGVKLDVTLPNGQTESVSVPRDGEVK